MAEPKILLWDIESTSLNADFGIILCIGWKWYGEKKVHVARIDKKNGEANYCKECKRHDGNDLHVIKDFLKALDQADIQVTWYGKRFDEPMIRSRWVFHKQKGNIPQVQHDDLWFTARKELKLSSNRLKSVQSFLDLDDEKTEIKGRIWLDAILGKTSALNYIVDHCKKDVLVLEQAYEKLKPFTKVNRPNQRVMVKGKKVCPACTSKRLKSWGRRFTANTAYVRYRCLDCGAWCSAPPTRPEDTR
jgi:uncharacterized protein YprB with RNaseH-like and TPR domain